MQAVSTLAKQYAASSRPWESPVTVAVPVSRSSTATRAVIDRTLVKTSHMLGKQAMRVFVSLGSRDVSRPSGELCIEEGEGGGGDLPVRL